jgi:hypothetical protein
LLNLLQDENASVRYSAVQALGQLDLDDDVIVSGLLDLLKDHDSLVRLGSIRGLGKLGYTSDTVIRSLLSLVQDEVFLVRSFAAVLAQLGKTNEPAGIDARLRDWLEQNPRAEGASNAVDALWKLVVGEE